MADERHPVVLVHGYSDSGESFEPWKRLLVANGFPTEEIDICSYQSLTNEVTIRDIAEGFDRALRTRPHLRDGQPFSAIVHSTGMLVLRSWMTTYAGRRGRLKRLIALAPATFGSPLAHKGRGFLGALFKGNNAKGPDFLEAGDSILDALELGSRFTWDLTQVDVLGENPFFGRGSDTPYVFVLCGTESYRGIRQLANEPGTDGTVRWAGCALNTQKIVIDFTRDPAADQDRTRVDASDIDAKGVLPMPVWLIGGLNHATILSDPSGALTDLVVRALRVRDRAGFEDWQEHAERATAETRQAIAAGQLHEWQQFVVRATDERGDPIADYHVELYTLDHNGQEQVVDFDVAVHAYGADKSLRCFHVDLTVLRRHLAREGIQRLWGNCSRSPSGSSISGCRLRGELR